MRGPVSLVDTLAVLILVTVALVVIIPGNWVAVLMRRIVVLSLQVIVTLIGNGMVLRIVVVIVFGVAYVVQLRVVRVRVA
jgi:hypothetical protein